MALLERKAQTLQEAIRNLNPQHSLSVDELAKFYVAREGSPVERVAISLEDPSPQKFLFTGHRGNGKSTELAKLEAKLQDRFFVVRYALKNVLDLHDLTYIDVLLSLALQLAESAKDKVKLSKNTRSALESLWSFGLGIEKQTETGTTKGWQAELGLGEAVSTLLRLGVRIKSEHVTRQALREKVRYRVSDLLKGLDILAQDVFDETGKRVLCIVEDLDKIDLKEARTIFYDHGKSISAPDLTINIIYTFPVALGHSDEFMQIRHFFSDTPILPNFKLTDERGVESLRHLLLNRVEASLFEEEALDMLVEFSGGIPRQFITLARDASLEARVAAQAKVMVEHAHDAVARERQNFSRMLSEEQLSLLRRVKEEKKIDQTPAYQTLLHTLSVLEYSNHDIWYDVNPLVNDLLK